MHTTLGCLQGKLLSADLFVLYLNDFISENCNIELNGDNVKLISVHK